MVKVHCRTNLDDYKGKNWPTVMICRPKKGDAVQSDGGNAVLHVVSVTHAVVPAQCFTGDTPGEPYLIVELHKYYPRLDSCVCEMKHLDDRLS